jgi:CO/xanthine dehydrogenase FAD-binding subunit
LNIVIDQIGYCKPESLDEACSLLERFGDNARIIAGGQSLIPLLKLNLVQLGYVIDLKRVPGLSYIELKNMANKTMEEGNSVSSATTRFEQSATLCVGALTTYSEIQQSAVVKRNCPLLIDAVREIGHPQIRNRGTIGGSLCHSDPSADLIPTILTLNAQLVTVSKGGLTRTIDAKDFFAGPFSTSLRHGEILKEIRIPIRSMPGVGYSFKKFTLGHGSFPLVVVSIIVSCDDDYQCNDCAIAVAGVAEKPFRCKNAENVLTRGGKISWRHQSTLWQNQTPEMNSRQVRNIRKPSSVY